MCRKYLQMSPYTAATLERTSIMHALRPNQHSTTSEIDHNLELGLLRVATIIVMGILILSVLFSQGCWYVAAAGAGAGAGYMYGKGQDAENTQPSNP